MFMSMTPLRAAIALLIYVAACMMILMFSAPDYAAEAHAKSPSAHASLGSYATKTIYAQWIDPARACTVPVRILAPRGADPFPVILFSHGLGGAAESNVPLSRPLNKSRART